jgi:DNA-binding CsgD family transcriptional regulator/tetratricopeptide (TPR) repeat protein
LGIVRHHGRVAGRTAEPLLERDEPLGLLREVFAECAVGTGRLVLVTGEAGVGKTALVQEMADEVRSLHTGREQDVRVFIGSCEMLFTPRPLGPIADVALQAGGPLQDVIRSGPRVYEILPVLLGMLAERPTVIVLEDLHWADEATLDLLKLLGRRLEATCSLIVGTYRDDELASDHPLYSVLGSLAATRGVQRLRLEPLSLDSVRELAAARTGVDGDELYRRTGGNPFFVTEALASGGPAVPQTVRDAVIARAATLEPGGRRLLQAMSIVPGHVSPDLLEALAGDDVSELDDCLSSGVLVWADSTIAFRHELARLTIEEGIDPVRRNALHRTALDYLMTHGDDPARVAHHAEAIGDADTVAEYAPRAAAEASARGAHREAAAQYSRALRFGASLSLERRAELYELGGHEYYLIDWFADAVVCLEEAVQLRRATEDRRAEGDALRRLSAVQRCGGRHADASKSAYEAIRLLEDPPTGAELAAAYANLGMLALNDDDHDRARTAAAKALEIARAVDHRPTIAHALNTLGSACLYQGDLSGLGLMEASLAIALEDDLEEHAGRAYLNTMDAAHRNRDWVLIDRLLDVGTDYCCEHGLDLWLRYLDLYRARSELDRGRWSAAEAAIPASAEDPGTPLARIVAVLVLGLLRVRRGDPGGWDALDEAQARADASGELQFRAPVAAARAEAAWLTGREFDIEAATDGPLDGCLRSGLAWWAGELAWRRREAGIDEPVPPGIAAPWRLMLEDRLPEAAAEWERAGCPYEEAVALAATDDEDNLARAVEILRGLGAAAAVARVSRRARDAGIGRLRRGPRAATRANPRGLTPREIEVLALMASGLRNGDIAERLVVSTRTVDHHVSAVLSKLGVPNRAAAVREAVRLGIDVDAKDG